MGSSMRIPASTESRAIENQYPTMKTADICDLPIAKMCADDAALYLWATAPKLREALSVLDAWGFEYVTNLLWVKPSIGMGYWARGRHEILLVGKRGKMSPPEATRRPDSVIEADRGKHSEKPSAVRDMIAACFPDAHRVELFAREKVDGWDGWGNDVVPG